MLRKDVRYLKWNIRDLIKAIMLFIACICSLPMILGTNYSLVGLILFVILIIVQAFKLKGIATTRNAHFNTYIAAIILFIYCALNCIFLQSDRLVDGLKTIVLLIVIVTAFFLLFQDKIIASLFVQILYISMIFMVISYIISVLLMFIFGWDSIYITSFDYGYYRDTEIYFPFTLTYGNMPFNGVIFKRLLGFARESGLMQVFYVWGFFMADKYFDKVWIVRIFMSIGVFACFSTAGFIVFCISLLLFLSMRQFLSKKTFVIIALAGVAVYMVFYASGTSIFDRASSTVEDRTLGIQLGVSVFMQKPIFGGGFYSTLGDSSVQSGVCALASIGQVGIVGFVLWLFVFASSLYESKNKKRFIYTNAALFITALFSQPIMFAPVMYWFLFVDYDNYKIRLVN